MMGLDAPMGLDPLREAPQPMAPQAPGTAVPEGGQSFGELFTGFLKDVNAMQNQADESIKRMVAGEVKDVHQVMLAVGEAKVAFNLLLEIRNKTMEAYREILNMRG